MLNHVLAAARRITLAAAVLAAAAIQATAFETKGDGSVNLKVGALYLPTDAPFFLAVERGYFAAEKINVEFQRVASGSDLISFVATGAIDVGSGGATPGLFNAFNRGIKLEIVAAKSIMLKPDFGSTVLVTRKDLADSGAIKSVADLKGRKVAINSIQSTSINYIVRLLDAAGLKREDVEIVELPVPQLLPALTGGAIDVAMVFGVTQDALDKANAVEIAGGRVLDIVEDGDVSNMMFYSPGFAATPTAQRFMTAYLKGHRDYYRAIIAGKEGRHEVCEVIRKYINFMPEDCKGFPMPGADPDARISQKSLEAFQKEWLDWNIMREPAPIADFINMSFIDKAVEELGAYED